ncbi:MAG: adenosylcobinamide-GDP ribazoletransferase [Hespellia sp.]|nr:adenosylcobinamide-GDP ribazoletransferase [Hespellia sp.]
MGQLWNNFKIAFSMYSKIPMPRSDWKKENMKYAMCFFPWIGAAIGVCSVLFFYLMSWLQTGGTAISDSFVTVVLLLIPVCITGGIHLDGLLDTADAMSSYQERERRLEILKDSHAGAFAIITCVVYFLLYYGVYSMVTRDSIVVIGCSFLLSRTLSGLSVVTFPLAKGTGLVATFSDHAQKKTVRKVLFCYLILVSVVMCIIGGVPGGVGVALAGLTFWYYYRMSVKNFGGITGDLAGWFLQICELVMALGIVLADVFMKVS